MMQRTLGGSEVSIGGVMSSNMGYNYRYPSMQGTVRICVEGLRAHGQGDVGVQPGQHILEKKTREVQKMLEFRA